MVHHTIQTKIFSGTLLVSLAAFEFAPLAFVHAQDFPGGTFQNYDFQGMDSGTFQNLDFQLDSSGGGSNFWGLGGLLSSSGVSCGGSGGSGGFLGSLFGSSIGSIGKVFGGFLGGSSGSGGGGETFQNLDFQDTESGTFQNLDFTSGGGSDIFSGLFGGSGGFDSILGGGIGGGFGSILGGGGEVPVNDKTVRNETGRIRTNTGEIVKKECIYDPIAKALTAFALRALTANIFSWAQNDDIGFVQNYEQYFRNIAAGRGSEFLANFSRVPTIGNSNEYIRQALSAPTPLTGGFSQTFRCPVPQVADGSFFQDFDNGGWSALHGMMGNSACNIDGLFLMTLQWQAIEEQNALNAAAAEIMANSGYRGYQVKRAGRCEMTVDGIQMCVTENVTKTAGGIIADLVNRAFGSSIDWIVNADEVNEVIEAAIGFLVNTLISNSRGPSGSGFYSAAFTSQPQTQPGGFSQSTVMVQIHTQIARADRGMEAVDAAMASALSALLGDAVTILSLRATITGLSGRLASATDAAEIASLSSQIASANVQLNTAITQFSSSKARFLAAVTSKTTLLRIRADLLTLRGRLLTTANPMDVETIATDIINLENALDVAFEIAGISVETLAESANTKAATIAEIDQTNALAARTAARIDIVKSRQGSIGTPGYADFVALLDTRKAELSALSQTLTSLRAIVAAETDGEAIRTNSINALRIMISTTAKIFEIDAIIGNSVNNNVKP